MAPQFHDSKTDSLAASHALSWPSASLKQCSTSQQRVFARLLRSEGGTEATDATDSMRALASDVMGANVVFHSPFGAKVATFADFSAGGKALRSIEAYVRQHALPLLGDSPVPSSSNGVQAASLLEEARRAIAHATNAFTDGPVASDCIILLEPGSSGAVDRLIVELGLDKVPTHVFGADEARPVVLLGPFVSPSDAHRWQASAADVVCIPENGDGRVDLKALQQSLKHYGDRPLKVGVFAAASSLTGLLTDVDAVTELLHRHGALSLWDYSTAAPHALIDMNPVSKAGSRVAKDALYFSGHKLLGARGSPGVLIAKKTLLSKASAASLDANAIGSICLGLALQLQESVGDASIAKRERRHVDRVRESLAASPNVVLLGHDDVQRQRLPLFSFLVRFGDRFLHYNFVSALLHDLFGVHVRVALEGSHGARLLGLSTSDRLALEQAVEAHNAVLKPGFVHVSLPFCMGDAEVDFVLAAVRFVASDGWKFLPQYAFDRVSGEWTHRDRSSRLGPQQLSALSSAASLRSPLQAASASQLDKLEEHREQSLQLAQSLASQCEAERVDDFCCVTLDVSLESLRWFAYPVEAVAAMRSRAAPELTGAGVAGPFQPQMYLEGALSERWTLQTTPSRQEPVVKRPARTRARLARFVRFCSRLSRCRRGRSAAGTTAKCKEVDPASFSW